MATIILLTWTVLVLVLGLQLRKPLVARVQAYSERAQVSRALREYSESNTQVDSLVKAIDDATFQTYLSVVNEALERERNGQHIPEGRVQELSRILQELNSKTQQLKTLVPESRSDQDRPKAA